MRFAAAMHVLTAVIWVGGLFFAYFVLRPVAANMLETHDRLNLWRKVLRRFFHFVWVSVITLWAICRSPFGRVLMAIRENPMRANFVGVNPYTMRLAAFVVAGTFAGIAGALFAMYNKGMYVESAFWPESAQELIMVLLGGVYSFFGPALGASV